MMMEAKISGPSLEGNRVLEVMNLTLELVLPLLTAGKLSFVIQTTDDGWK